MLETYKERVAEQIYEKFIHETYNVQGEYCEDEISDLLLNIQVMGYKYRCLDLNKADFIETREPEVIINNYCSETVYKTVNETTNIGQRLSISTSTYSSIKPLIIGDYSFQDDSLINQDVVAIFVNNIPEFLIAGQFTFNKTTGTVTRTQSWNDQDTLVII